MREIYGSLQINANGLFLKGLSIDLPPYQKRPALEVERRGQVVQPAPVQRVLNDADRCKAL